MERNNNTSEILRILDMLEENLEVVSLDGIYVCSYYESKGELQRDLDKLARQGIIVKSRYGYARNTKGSK